MKVVEMTARAFWKGEYGITGTVEDGEQRYQIKMDVKGSDVNSCSCSCEQGISYKGMCDHAKLLLEHVRRQELEDAGMPVTTSAQVRTMIREYTNREVAEIVREGEEEQVEFLPQLFIGRNDVRMEFKLGRDRFYVVKDLVAFSQAVNHGAYVEYGKELAFHHSLDVFSKKSRPLVELVVELVNTYVDNYQQFQKNAGGAAPSLRRVTLGRGSRDRAMESLLNQEVETEDYRGVSRKATVKNGIPELVIAVRRARKEAIKVSVDKKLSSFMGEKYLYLLEGDILYRCDEECSQALAVFFQQMTQGFGAPYEVTVNSKDIPLFYERVLKKLEPYGVLDVDDVDLDRMRPAQLRAEFLFDCPRPGEVVLRPTLRYGSYSFHPVNDEKVPRTVTRDVPGEFRVGQLITKYFKYREAKDPDFVIKDDDDAIYRLLDKGMAEFAQLGEVMLTDSAKHVKILPSPKVSLGVSVMGDWLELTIDAGHMTGADLQRILSEYRQKKPYYRLKSGEFVKLDLDGFMTVARMIDGLAVSKSDILSKKIRVPKYRAFYLDSLYKETGTINLYRDQLFKSIVRGIKSVEDSDFEVPKTLRPVLKGYQKTGFRWLRTLDSCGFGGILADDMGLGKTIQVISLLLDEKQKNLAEGKKPGTSLIVCPASLVYNWEYEIHNFAPELEVEAITGFGWSREYRLQSVEDYDVVITSYELLRRDIQLYENMEFRFQIIDEAQYIKNPATQSAKAVKVIHSRTRFALTGTPIENRLSELWSIFDYLMPGFLFSYQKFKKNFEAPIVKDGNSDVLWNLHQLTGPFILRRLKEDVLKELPDKLENIVYSRFDEEQKELYTANAVKLKRELEGQSDQEYGTGRMQVLAELTKLRQVCCDPKLYYENYRGRSAKLDTCMELLGGAVEAGHKVLLFSQFTSMLDIIGKRLDKDKVKYHVLTGATSKEDRMRMVNQFHEDDVPVFLISLKAGGTGLNLTAADVVIHYDPWWNVAAQNQATDRTHRIGQEKQVTVFKLIMKDTIEESILKLQEAKRSLAEQIITEGTVSLSSLSKDDLLEILK